MVSIKKALIFGAKGMLAYDLIRSFRRKGYIVIGADIKECDITDSQAVRRFIRRHRPSLVVNTAALQNMDACERDPEGTFRVNALGPFHIAVASAEHDIPIVQMSTIYVFDGSKRTAYCETDCPNPVNVYGTTKLAGEGFVRTANPQHYIVRTNFLFGSHYNSTLGGNGNFVQRILLLARKNGRVKAVTDQIVSMAYTRDLAEAIVRLVRSGHYGTYHITNAGSENLYNEAREILRLSGLNKTTILSPARLADFSTLARRPKYTVVASVLLRKAGVPALRPWRSALRAYLAEIGALKRI